MNSENTLSHSFKSKNVGVIAEFNAHFPASLGQSLSKLARVTRFIFQRVGCARYLVLYVLEPRFNLYGFLCIDNLPITPQFSHDTRWFEGPIKFRLIGIKVQYALRDLIILKPLLLAQSLKLAPAVGAKIHHLANIMGRFCRSALSQKRQRPAPLCWIHPWPKQKRRIGFKQPSQYL